jgi:hypothetical protein
VAQQGRVTRIQAANMDVCMAQRIQTGSHTEATSLDNDPFVLTTLTVLGTLAASTPAYANHDHLKCVARLSELTVAGA